MLARSRMGCCPEVNAEGWQGKLPEGRCGNLLRPCREGATRLESPKAGLEIDRGIPRHGLTAWVNPGFGIVYVHQPISDPVVVKSRSIKAVHHRSLVDRNRRRLQRCGVLEKHMHGHLFVA